MARAALIACLLCFALAAPAAHAKEGVVATLEQPWLLRDASAGDRISVAWRLADATDRPFGASEIYLRVRDAALGRSRGFPARAAGRPGRFVAKVRIPRAGIGAIEIGLQGIRMVPGRAPVRADLMFAIVNDPFAVRWSRLGPIWPRLRSGARPGRW